MVIRWILLALALTAVVIAVTTIRPVSTPGPLARDFEAYWSAGAEQNNHTDPYGRAIWISERGIPGVDARRYELLPFVGPPHTLLAWSLAARLRYERATYVWWIVLAASLLGLVVTVIAASGVGGSAQCLLGVLLLAVTFGPITSNLALGQIALPAFLGGSLVVVFARRWWPAAALAACLAFAQPNAAIGLISQLGRNRATLAIATGALVTYALGAIEAGWAWPFVYVRAIAEHRRAEEFAAIQFSPASIAFDFGASPAAAHAIAAVVAVATVVCAIRLAFVVRDAFARFAAFSALSPMIAGFFHEHDFVVAFGAAAWCALRSRGAVRSTALAGTLLAGFDWFGLAQRPSGIAQSALLGVAAFAAFLALGENSEAPRAIPVAVGLVLLAGGAAIIALRHPAPIWPDALPIIHYPADATAAEVWRVEQLASGLLATVPAWGALRALSLLGCALLAYAIYRHPSYYRTARRRSDGSS
jgi:hypothetical protein